MVHANLAGRGDDGASNRTRIALVGHCGPDSSMLRGVAQRAVPGSLIEEVDDQAGASRAAMECDLLLINRMMDGEFTDPSGTSLIAALGRLPGRRASLILVSNYADAQEMARAAGAMPGFGKAVSGRPESADKIRAAVARAVARGESKS